MSSIPGTSEASKFDPALHYESRPPPQNAQEYYPNPDQTLKCRYCSSTFAPALAWKFKFHLAHVETRGFTTNQLCTNVPLLVLAKARKEVPTCKAINFERIAKMDKIEQYCWEKMVSRELSVYEQLQTFGETLGFTAENKRDPKKLNAILVHMSNDEKRKKIDEKAVDKEVQQSVEDEIGTDNLILNDKPRKKRNLNEEFVAAKNVNPKEVHQSVEKEIGVDNLIPPRKKRILKRKNLDEEAAAKAEKEVRIKAIADRVRMYSIKKIDVITEIQLKGHSLTADQLATLELLSKSLEDNCLALEKMLKVV